MATTFTDDEVATAVNQFLLTSVSVPQTKTGARDILTLKSGVYDLLTTALLLRPESYFYVINLAKNRLVGLLQQQIDDLNSIITAAPNSTRPSKKVTSTTDLANAQAAILDLNAGLNARISGVRGSIGPAVDRFRRSVSSFVSSELTKNVVVAGAVTPTGPEIQNNIATLWASAVARHAQIVTLATNIEDALLSLEAVKLPETSVRDIVSRIQTKLDEVKTTMEGDTAIQDSRTSMLNLLTMRTLLTKASTFTNPKLDLMPLRGDSNLVAFADAPGVEASILGSISGPFNYGPGAALALSVNGGPVNITLPLTTQGSRAELRSKVFTPWVAPTAGDQLAFIVDHAGLDSVVLAAYVSGPVAAVALNAALGPSMSVTWDAGTSQLVFQSTNNTDASHLRLLYDTALRIGGRDWSFPITEVSVTEVSGRGVSIEDVVNAVSTQTTLISAQKVEVVYRGFTGERTAVIGEEAMLWERVDFGADLVSTGIAAVTSPSKNFETLGARPGMGLHTSAPTVADYTITAVSGNELTLDPAPPVGVLTYYLGPDHRDVPNGARVQVTSGTNRDNSGLYRVAVGGGQIARVIVDRNLFTPDARLAVTVYTRFLELSARGTTTTSGIGVLAPSTGATALGYPVTALATRPQLTLLQIQGNGDFLLRNVRAGDIIRLTSPTALIYSVEITSVTAKSVSIVTGVPFEAGNWTYEISSARAGAYITIQAASGAWLTSTYVAGFARLDTLVGRLIRGARYTGDIALGVTGYEAALVTYQTALSTYTVPREKTIDNVVRTFREQGFDRALDLFLTLDVTTLFTMDDDGVSYSTWLTRQSATVAREVVPVSKLGRGQQIIQEWRPVSFQPDPYDPRGGKTDP